MTHSRNSSFDSTVEQDATFLECQREAWFVRVGSPLASDSYDFAVLVGWKRALAALPIVSEFVKDSSDVMSHDGRAVLESFGGGQSFKNIAHSLLNPLRLVRQALLSVRMALLTAAAKLVGATEGNEIVYSEYRPIRGAQKGVVGFVCFALELPLQIVETLQYGLDLVVWKAPQAIARGLRRMGRALAEAFRTDDKEVGVGQEKATVVEYGGGFTFVVGGSEEECFAAMDAARRIVQRPLPVTVTHTPVSSPNLSRASSEETSPQNTERGGGKKRGKAGIPGAVVRG